MAVGYFATWFFIHVLHHNTYPFSRTILPPSYFGADFICYSDRFPFFHQAGFFTHTKHAFTYPAAAAVAYEVFYGFSTKPLLRFREVGIAAFVVAALFVARALVRRRIRPAVAVAFTLTLLACSYPFQLLFYLSNMEFAVWLTLVLAFWAYVCRQEKTAAILFGIAASIKIFPVIFLALFLPRRRYAAIALGILAAAVSSIASLALLGPTIGQASQGIAQGLEIFRIHYLDRFLPLEGGIDHSLYSSIKLFFYHAHDVSNLHAIALMYVPTVAALGIVLYFWKIRSLPAINQVLCLIVASVLLPPLSHDYTLTHLYVPFTLFVLYLLDQPHKLFPDSDVNRNARSVSATWPFLVCFLLLFAPENYLVYHGLRLAGSFKCIVLIVLFVLSMRIRLPGPLDDITLPQPAAE